MKNEVNRALAAEKTSFEIIWEFLAPAEQFLNRREACERLWKGLTLKKQRQIYATLVWQREQRIEIETTRSCLSPSTANITGFIANSIRRLLRWKTRENLIEPASNAGKMDETRGIVSRRTDIETRRMESGSEQRSPRLLPFEVPSQGTSPWHNRQSFMNTYPFSR